jgi:hypothetical protein
MSRLSTQLLTNFYKDIEPLYLCFQENILLEEDDADHRAFLQKTMVASTPAAIALGERPTGEETTMFDVIDLVLLRLFKQNKGVKPRNILALGYQAVGAL